MIVIIIARALAEQATIRHIIHSFVRYKASPKTLTMKPITMTNNYIQLNQSTRQGLPKITFKPRKASKKILNAL